MAQHPSGPRGPGVVYGVIVLALLVALAALAMTNRQPPPPTIAEFAPQAIEQIADSPEDQSSHVGRGDGTARAIQTQAPAEATAQKIVVPRVRRCVGDPPRQIEDPQSPPCVPYWAGDNGGATAKGVTRDEVRIAWPGGGADEVPLWTQFFNRRFEFYGRSIRMIAVPGAGSLSPEGQQAAAVGVDEQLHAFASLPETAHGGVWYAAETGRRGIVTAQWEASLGEDVFTRYRPYLWMYPTSLTSQMSVLGDWICSSIARGKAAHAADSVTRSQTRAFGIVYTRYVGSESPERPTVLSSKLDDCGASAKTIEVIPQYGLGDSSGPADQNASDYANAALRMKLAGVTSVVCLCNAVFGGVLATHASGQGYTPEWILTTYLAGDVNQVIRTWNQAEAASAFGLSFVVRHTQLVNYPGYWAAREVNPSYSRSGDENGIGTPMEAVYGPLLLLASGIQMAGPRLTPQAFESALHRTRFPNPPSPLQPGRVGFNDGDHSMIDDAAQIWWNPAALAPDDKAGAFCYVNAGGRRAGDWPRDSDPFFTGKCDART